MKFIDEAVLGSPSQIVFVVCVDKMCQSSGAGLPVPDNKPGGFCGRKATLKQKRNVCQTEFRGCVNVDVAVLGSPRSLTVLADVQQH